jgi:hypothetical protein
LTRCSRFSASGALLAASRRRNPLHRASRRPPRLMSPLRGRALCCSGSAALCVPRSSTISRWGAFILRMYRRRCPVPTPFSVIICNREFLRARGRPSF